jgi:hypothetical protein
MEQLARLPTRNQPARCTLGVIFGTAGLVIRGSKHFLDRANYLISWKVVLRFVHGDLGSA